MYVEAILFRQPAEMEQVEYVPRVLNPMFHHLNGSSFIWVDSVSAVIRHKQSYRSSTAAIYRIPI